jgi:hypothetical protein
MVKINGPRAKCGNCGKETLMGLRENTPIGCGEYLTGKKYTRFCSGKCRSELESNTLRKGS